MRRFLNALVLLCLLCACRISAQVITTVAGTNYLFPLQPQPALNAPLGHVTGVAVDSKGNIYASDRDDNIVVRLASDGTLSIVAGNGEAGFSGDGGPATSASLNGPNGLALDGAGNLYIADVGNNRIRKVSAGQISTVAGSKATLLGDGGPATAAMLNQPADIKLDAAGNLFIADFMDNRVRKVVNGIITTIAGNGQGGYSGDNGPATNATFAGPSALAIDPSGAFYIADQGNQRVRRVSSAGDISTYVALLNNPTGLALDKTGALYVADTFNDRISKYNGGPTIPVAGGIRAGFSGDGGPATRAFLALPSGLAFDASGNLFVGDSDNGRIRKIDTGGLISTVAGTGQLRTSPDGGLAVSTLLYNPSGVTVDSAGNLYIADTSHYRVRKVTNGIITTIAGSGANPCAGGFCGQGITSSYSATPAAGAAIIPTSIAVDPIGNVYIVETGRIHKISNGTITTIAGGGFKYPNDGGSATDTQIFPDTVVVDPNGNVYVSEPAFDRVRKITNGIITTVAGTFTPGFTGDGGPASKALLSAPSGLALDNQGNLYIADGGNDRIRVVKPNGTITTIAGNGMAGSSGDGGPALSASVSPLRLAVDAAGNLFFSESAKIREISNGIIRTVAGTGTLGFAGDGGPAINALLTGTSLFAGIESVLGDSIALDTKGNLFLSEGNGHRIREVVATNPSFLSTPATLSFTGVSGGATPAFKTVNLTSTVASLNYSTSVSDAWLTVSPATGAIPTALQVTTDPSQLAPGSYTGTVTITAPDASPLTQTISVSFVVTPPPSGRLALSTQTFSFSFTQGGSASSVELGVANVGSASIAFTASATTSTGGNWLQVSAASATVTAALPTSLTITATPGTLPPGTYNGTITISSASTGQTLSVSVNMAISAPPKKILLSQTGLTFTAVAQGGTPLSQSFGILNVGQGSMDWTATATTLSGGSGWLSLDSTSGTVTTPFLSVSIVNVSVDASRLAAGDYYGQIQVKAAGASNSPQSVSVILSVLPPGSNPGPEVRPTGLIFTGAAGATPGSQDVRVGNPSGQATNYLSGSIGNGFSFAPTNAQVDPNQPTTVRIFPDFSTLAPASILRGTITLQFSDGTPRNISILTVVAPSGGNSSIPNERFAAGCAPTKLLPVFAQLGGGSGVPVGFPATVAAKIVDDCGNPMTTGSVAVSFSNGDPPISLVSLQDGTWSNSWQPMNNASTVAVSLDARIPDQNLSGHAQSTIGLQGSKSIPIYGGALSAATQTAGPLALGDLILLKGSGLADGKASGLGLQLAGASLLIGGETAQLLYADSTQVIGLIPPDLTLNSSQQVLVLHGNNIGLPTPVLISATHPEVLTKDGSGLGQGSIYKISGGSTATLADVSNPVRPGDTVLIYCSGLGQTNANGIAMNQPTISICGLTAQMSYAGVADAKSYPSAGAPSLLGGTASAAGGLYQIVAVVPAGVQNGQAVVLINSAGQTSQAGVTLAITGGAATANQPVITSINTAYGSADIGQNDFIEIHGNNLAAAVTGPASLSSQLGGVSVSVNGKAALLYYVSSNQINALTPLDSSLGPVSVVVTSNGVSSASFTASLKAVTPAFLRFDSTHITATHADGTLLGPPSLGAAFTPGVPGETIVAYAVGFGLPSVALTSGSASQSGSLPVLPACQLGNAPASVAFAGLNGFAGLYQLNIIVPSGASNGDNLISCTYGGQVTASGTTLSIQR
jgi:uncharacterized protein (TIGR03437 family)